MQSFWETYLLCLTLQIEATPLKLSLRNVDVLNVDQEKNKQKKQVVKAFSIDLMKKSLYLMPFMQ